MDELLNRIWLTRSRTFKMLMYSLGIVVPASLAYVVIANAGNTSTSANQSAIRESTDNSPGNQLPTIDNSDRANSNEIHTTVSTSTNSNTTNNAPVETSVTVNGQPIPVPTNGSTHQTVKADNGSTDVDITSSSSSQSNGSSTIHLNVHSSSSSKTDSDP